MQSLGHRLLAGGTHEAFPIARVSVDIPRPRPLAAKRQPAMLACVDEIWRLIEEEVRPGRR